MRQYEILAPGSPYTLVEREIPSRGPGEALVRLRAASLNYRDILILDNPKTAAGRVPLSDGAGEVVAVGEGVTHVRAGDRVTPNFFSGWIDGPVSAAIHDTALGGAVDGTLREYGVFPADSLALLPDGMSFEAAAALPCAGVTVWNSFFETGDLRAGQTVLLLGTGGVSIFGLAMAKAAGARVILTSSSDEKLARGREMGADETINYRTDPDWERAAYRLSDGGVDHVLEVGGAGTLERSLKATRSGGTISLIGVLTGVEGQINPWTIVGRSLRVNGIYVGSRTMFDRMLAFLDEHRIAPTIDRTFPFTEAPAAIEHLKSGSHFGKVVITID